MSRSLITVTYNSAETLRRFWASAPLDETTEWVVVDNASTDDTVAVATSLGARVISLPENRGFSFANNVGLSAATGDFVGFVNPDVRMTKETIDVLQSSVPADGGIVGPQLVNSDGTEQPNGRGFPLLSAKVRNRLRGDDSRYLLSASTQDPRPVVWLMGAAVFARRETLDLIGAWDPHFFLYYEDSDIGVRAWRAGTRVLLIPTARAEHGWARETSGRFRWAPWRREIASMVKFYARYPEFLAGYRTAANRYPELAALIEGGDHGAAVR